MNKDADYRDAYTKAKANLEDLKERGEKAEGENVLEHLETILTREEIRANNVRVAAIGEHSKEGGDKIDTSYNRRNI